MGKLKIDGDVKIKYLTFEKETLGISLYVEPVDGAKIKVASINILGEMDFTKLKISTNGELTIGNTTLTETQLQQLLALLNS